MLMSEYTSVVDDVLDAMGEITNMIIGNIKTVLEDRYGQMGISVPTVVYGRNFATRTVSRGEWVIVSFSVGGQILQVHINLARNPAESSESIVPGFRRTEPVLA
jgi:chemotaxis protein CheX